MSDAIDAFLDAAPKADSSIDAFLDAGSNPGTTERKPYFREPSTIAKLFIKYAPDFMKEFATEAATGKYAPDVAYGMSGVTRGAMNLVSPGSGNKAFTNITGFTPEMVNKDSTATMVGQLFDPVALAAGGVIGKGVQLLPFVAKSAQMVNAAQAARTAGVVVPKVTKGAQVVNHVVAPALTGALTGGSTGYLASEGDLQDAGTCLLYTSDAADE